MLNSNLLISLFRSRKVLMDNYEFFLSHHLDHGREQMSRRLGNPITFYGGSYTSTSKPCFDILILMRSDAVPSTRRARPARLERRLEELVRVLSDHSI